ncbi:hypothetical protein FBU30_010505 [Linnemannia zychae]|nr:hypothetical protein FBU30_010505 [Linnemannia zychae]
MHLDFRSNGESLEFEADEGVELWREFCSRRVYHDDDRVMPEKLLDYVELICLPYDGILLQQNNIQEDESSISSLLSLRAPIRPVLRLWVQKVCSFSTPLEFPDETLAVEDDMDKEFDDDSDYLGDKASQFSGPTAFLQDVDSTTIIREQENYKIADLSTSSGIITGLDANLAMGLSKGKQQSNDALVVAEPGKSFTVPFWPPGRYKANEFDLAKFNGIKSIPVNS